MSSFKPSAEQQPAIEHRGHDILVSASAGSGKTAVLVERVIQLLEKDRLNIDQLLMVTFTKEAAKNMRERIRKRLMASPDQHMKEQISRLAVANISTIHSFCEQLIKRYYYTIDLDPNYRLVTDAEQNLLMDQVWHDLVNDWLTGDQKATYLRVADNFAQGVKGEGLAGVVRKMDQEANAQPDPNGWLTHLIDNYELDDQQAITDTHFYQAVVKPIAQAQLFNLLNQWQNLSQVAENDKLRERLAEDLSKLEQLFINGELVDDWDLLVAATEKKSFGINPKKTKDSSEVELAQLDQRNALKSQLDEIHKTYFNWSSQRYHALLPKAKTILEQLVNFSQQFRQRYQRAKQQRHLLDFSDLEHYAYAILTGRAVLTNELLATHQATATQIRRELQFQYQEIMVDEFQDTNRLQYDLLQQLHDPKRNHLFMVGDMKQSIYRFRQADPTLFLENYQRFRQANDPNEALDLSDNYRSMTNITEFTNVVFKQLMNQGVGEMDYDQTAELRAKAQWQLADGQVAPARPTEMLVYRTNHNPAIVGEDRLTGEVQMVATRIRQLLDNEKETIFDQDTQTMRRIKPNDIVILSRTKAANSQIVEQFGQLNIPVTVHGVENYFKATEIRIVMSLLRIIDNPYQDVPLVAVMRSPLIALPTAEAVIGFTEPEMAIIKLNHPDGAYYEAIQQFAHDFPEDDFPEDDFPGNHLRDGVDYYLVAQKVNRLLTLLNHLRACARQRSLAELIWEIYDQTSYLDYVGGMPGGPQRQANLHALYERASAYEQSSFKGLYQFIRFIEQMQRKDDDLGVAPADLANDSINVMTIHGSKGLQFPIVFLIDMNHQFRKDSEGVVIEPRTGIGMSLVENVHDQAPDLPPVEVKYELPQQTVIKEQLKRQNRAEEMRLLYVALTRAEQRLIITASVNDAPTNKLGNLKRDWNFWSQAVQSKNLVLNDALRLKANSMFDWLGLTLFRHPQFPAILDELDKPVFDEGSLQLGDVDFTFQLVDQALVRQWQANLPDVRKAGQTQLSLFGEDQPPLTKAQAQLMQQILRFEYPHQAATETTAYQAVSTIREAFRIQDPDDIAMGRLTIDADQVRGEGAYLKDTMAVPEFMQTNQAVTPTVLGTATHLLFERLDLSHGEVTLSQVTALRDQLVEQGLIPSSAVGDQLDLAAIVAFYQTDLGQQILAHPDQVQREVAFSMLLPGAKLFNNLTDQDGPILVHGIIDGYLVTDEGVELFDYKTDQITRTKLPQLRQRYQGQLALYASALASMLDCPLAKIKSDLYSVTCQSLV